MSKTKISSKYQLVIPKEIRRRMKLTCGMTVAIHLIDDEHALILKQPDSYTKALAGLGKNVWKKLGGAKKYLRKERTTW